MTVRDPAHPDRQPWVRAVKTTVVVATGAAPVLWLGTQVVSSWLEEPWGPHWLDLVSLLIFAAPPAMYAAFIRDAGFVVIVGAGLVLLSAPSFWAAFTSDASSAGLELLWVPFLGIPFVLVAWFIQALALPSDS